MKLIQTLLVYLGVLIQLCESCDDTGWTGFEDHCYLIQDEVQVTWQEARVLCLGEGGDLASIHSQAEQDFIEEQVNSLEPKQVELWLGMNQLSDRAGSISWSDKTTMNYTNWATAQPMVGGQTSCGFLSANPTNASVDIYPFTSTVSGLLNPDSKIPTDADDNTTFYFGQNQDGNFTWCMNLCRNNSSCAAATFYEYHYYTAWDHVCVGRSDTLQVLGPDNYGYSGVLSTSSDGLWKSANCGLGKGFVCKKVPGPDTPVSVPPTQRSYGSCPESYIEGEGNKCFKVVTTPTVPRTWEQALQICRSEPGYLPDLASIHSKADNDILVTKTHEGSHYWIGGFYWSSSDSLLWTDNTDPDYNNSLSIELFEENCCTMLNSSGAWSCESCDQMVGYICQTYKDPDVTTTPTPRDSCPPGWVFYWYTCYQFQAVPRTWSDAKHYCESQDSTLVTIHTELENEEIFTEAGGQRDGKLPIWIGLYKNTSLAGHHHYAWLDGWGVDYMNFVEGGQDNGEGCVAMVQSLRWNDTSCGNHYFSICKKRHHVTPTQLPANEGTCKSKWHKWGVKCYFLSKKQTGFMEALNFCKNMQSEPVEIETAMENNFIVSYAKSISSYAKIWIGLIRKSTNSSYHWNSGSNSTFRNWASQEPKHSGSSNCAMLGNLNGYFNPGEWSSESCSNSYNFVCETVPDPPITTPVTPTSKPGDCPSNEWVKHNNDCYLFRITEYYNWFVARRLCEYVSGGYGSLTSVNSYVENQWILSYAKLNTPPMEENYPDVWIGLSKERPVNGSTYVWDDGNSNPFQWWAPGEPNDVDGSEGCGRMYLFVGGLEGYWDDYRCTENKGLGLICKTPQSSQYSNLDIDETNFMPVTNEPTSKPDNGGSSSFFADHLIIFGFVIGVVSMSLATMGIGVFVRYVRNKKRTAAEPPYSNLLADSVDETDTEHVDL